MQHKFNLFRRFLFLLLYLLSSFIINAQNIWQDVSGSPIISSSERYIIPATYKTYALDFESLLNYLGNAPKEFSVNISNAGLPLFLPMPNGQMHQFSIVESSLMPNNLAVKFSGIKSYVGQGLDDKTATLRMSVDHNGFHAMIISASGTVYIDPYSLNNTDYCITYYKKDFYATNTKVRDLVCVLENVNTSVLSPLMIPGQSGDLLRTYRTAIAATGEYTDFHGGTVQDAMAAINTTLNRVNQVYERESAIRLILIDNNDLLIYLNSSSDPYSNGNAGAMIDQNQDNIDDVIGNDNYDIGHVFGTNSGGLASLGSVCNNSQKARGITGSFAPVGDPFDIDYVCHEVGHQFGGNHTQNNSCERTSSSAYEPGSASTIMGYAGICSPNLQNNSNDYIHTHTFDQFTNHINGVGWASDCAVQIETGNNIPVAFAGNSGFFIPIGTPFELEGSANDPDAADELTYCWEQFDLGPVTSSSDNNLTNPSGNQPIFRSWSPSTSSTRVFPRIQDLLDGTTTIGEHLPSYSRDLTFRLTVRDNRASGGGVSYDQMAFEVSDIAGPFTVNNITDVWEYGNTYSVNWDVANTDIEPVSCSSVDIYLSLDGGNNFQLLLEGVPNIGSADIICPNEVSNQARIKVKGSDNIFFNISNTFEIIESTAPNFAISVNPESLDICSEETAEFNILVDPILNFTNPVTLSIENIPNNISVNFDPFQVNPGDNSILTISSPLGIEIGNYSFDISAISGDIIHELDIDMNVYEDLPQVPELLFPNSDLVGVSQTPIFDWDDEDNANSYTLYIASDSAFTLILDSILNVEESTYSYGVLLDPETEYFWNVVSHNPCGSSESSDTLSFTTAQEGTTDIFGCTDPTAFNFDPTATVDNGSCDPFIYGCTNPDADNYDSDANTENGSCIVSGCTNQEADNYDETANNDDGSCIISGCTDPEAYNFNVEANFDDGSCVPFVSGCTDPDAYNFNPNANLEDGSCDYESLVIIQYEELEGSNFYFWAIINEIPTVNFLHWNMGDGTDYQDLDEPTHYFQENGAYQVNLNVYTPIGIIVVSTIVNVSNVSLGCMDENAVNFNPLATENDGSCIDQFNGCMDVEANNYNSNANVDDGSCTYDIMGCTDQTAFNYNENANVDDGSCIEIQLGCLDIEALNYNELANTDDGSCEYPLPTEPDWIVEITSTNHIILIPDSADITINDMPIDSGDYVGVFYFGQDLKYHCAGKMIWSGTTNTMTVYGSEPNEFNGMPVGEEFTWMTWKASINEVRMAIVDYDLTMPNTDTYVVDGISAIIALSNTMIQDIELNQGWNLISTYIIPDYPNISDVFEPIVNNLYLAKDEFGNVFWPEWDLNNIGDNTPGKAYKIKMNVADTLQVRGAIADPMDYPLLLPDGWSYLGYLLSQNQDPSVILESIEDDIILIKDNVGNIYFPEFGVNTMGDMIPGQGYQIRMTAEREFIYPLID